jgi:hypothetical protein
VFHVECKNCHSWATADCSCPPELAELPFHLPACKLADIGAVVTCPPDSGCCQLPHSHDANAMTCPGLTGGIGHPGEPCPHPDPVTCPAHVSSTSPMAGTPAHLYVPEGAKRALSREPLACPGGHCGLGVKGCTICRPVTITMLPGTANITVSMGA